MTKKLKLTVLNMNCNHCVATITKALEGLEDIKNIKFNLKKKEVIIKGEISLDQVIKVIEDAGYQVDK